MTFAHVYNKIQIKTTTSTLNLLAMSYLILHMERPQTLMVYLPLTTPARQEQKNYDSRPISHYIHETTIQGQLLEIHPAGLRKVQHAVFFEGQLDGFPVVEMIFKLQRSFEVTGSCVPILCRFMNIVRYWSRIVIFLLLPCWCC